MEPETIVVLSDSDEEDNVNAKIVSKTPISKPPNSTGNHPQIFEIDDSPTPPPAKLLKSSSSSLSFVPETPRSNRSHSSAIANFSTSSGDESILINSYDNDEDDNNDGDLDRKDQERSPKCSGKEHEIDFESWLDLESTFTLHKGGEPDVHMKGKGLAKRSSRENGRTLTDVEQNLEKRPYVVAKETCQEKESITATFNMNPLDSYPNFQSTCHFGNLKTTKTYDHTNQVQPSKDHDHEKEVRRKEVGAINKPENGDDGNAVKKQNKVNQAANRKKLTEEERLQEKLRKAELKDEAAKQKQLQKEKNKLEKYKFGEKDIVAIIDPKVLSNSVGGSFSKGPMLSMLTQKHLNSEINPNYFEKTIVWRMETPKEIFQHTTVKIDIRYILLIYGDAEEFCKLANDGSFMDHIASMRKHYPSYTICCLTNRLMSFINKREQQKYKQQKVASHWIRPPVEELFTKLTTQFSNVHSRHCVDEAEVAEHVVGLTVNLAKCHSRKKLTYLSVNANGSNVTKDCVDRSLIMKHPWLKALVSIPKVQPRFAIAIWKKYPTLKSLLRVYMDPTKSVSDKELLLEDLPLEDIHGNDKRLGAKCSKRIYRIFMAQDGSIMNDEAVDGAGYFPSQ